MNRQEFIASLPNWLRERADELLDYYAQSLCEMPNWEVTDEGTYFWARCNNERYQTALKELKETRPEVYEKYYAKYFSDTSSPTSTQVGGNHYKDCKIQPIDFILGNNLGYCEGNVIKYITRYKHKNGVEDLKKAKHYIDFLINEQGNQS